MAQRGLSAGSITALGAASVEFYYLVSIDFSTPVYYTTAPYDIDYDGNTYLSNATLQGIPEVTESLQIKPASFTLQMASTTAVMALMLGENKNADVYVYRYIVSTGQAIIHARGTTDGYRKKRNAQKGEGEIFLTVANHWSNWESTAGRTFSDAAQQKLYSGDLGFEFAGVTDPIIKYWGDLYAYIDVDPAGRWLINTSFTGSEPAKLSNFFDWTNGSIGNQSLPVVYGEASIKGTPVYRTLTGAGLKYLWVVYALSEGECDSLTDILFDGVSYTDASISGYVDATTDGGFHSGSTTQTAHAALVSASASWTSNHRLRGVCYVVIKYTYNKDIWSGEPRPQFILKGKKLYDPRTTTTAWSSNNALVLYDYLTNGTYGKALAAADLDAINAGANYTETTNTDHDGGEGGTPASINLFDFNGVIDTSETLKHNTELILFTMRAHLPWVSGLYTLVIERDDDTSVYAFNDDNIGGDFEVAEAGTRELANVVHYNFIDADNGYITDEIVADSASYLSADNNRVLRQDFTNKFENNRYRADNRANTELKKTRQQVRTTLEAANAEALQVQTGELVDVTSSDEGWSAKEFRVTEMKLKPGGGIRFSLEEYEPTVYDWNVSTETDPPANTTLLDPLSVTAPSGLALSSGTSVLIAAGDGTIISRIKATWTAPADAYVTGYNVYVKKGAGSKLLDGRINDPDTLEYYVSPVEDGATYTVYVAAVNSLGVESSEISDTETVVGKTAAPSNVSGFSAVQNGEVVVFKWAGVSDADLSGYEIRFGSQGSSNWADATPLTIATKGTNVTSAAVVTGDWTFYIKAIDTSGNESSSAASSDLSFTSNFDVIEQAQEAPAWSGTLTNFVRHHTGVLVPKSQNLASADGWDTFDVFVVNPYASCTYEAAEVDIGFDNTVRAWADIQSALGPGETGAADPALSVDYKLAAGAYDGFEGWSVGYLTGRYIKYKLTLDTSVGVAYVSGFKTVSDLLERTEKHSGETIAASGTTITFDTEFHNAPFIRITVQGTSALYATYTALSTTSVKVHVFNAAGTDVGGTVDLEAIGV